MEPASDHLWALASSLGVNWWRHEIDRVEPPTAVVDDWLDALSAREISDKAVFAGWLRLILQLESPAAVVSALFTSSAAHPAEAVSPALEVTLTHALWARRWTPTHMQVVDEVLAACSPWVTAAERTLAAALHGELAVMDRRLAQAVWCGDVTCTVPSAAPRHPVRGPVLAATGDIGAVARSDLDLAAMFAETSDDTTAIVDAVHATNFVCQQGVHVRQLEWRLHRAGDPRWAALWLCQRQRSADTLQQDFVRLPFDDQLTVAQVANSASLDATVQLSVAAWVAKSAHPAARVLRVERLGRAHLSSETVAELMSAYTDHVDVAVALWPSWTGTIAELAAAADQVTAAR